MITDKNKGIDITYNALNLPEVVAFGDGRKIKWQYSAGGTKLKKTIYDGQDSNPILTKHYERGFVYKNNNLETFPTEEGRLRKTNNGLRYEYDLKDHLGNVRATFTKDLDKDGRPDLQQADTYYPFGLKIAGMGEVNGPENKFTYNGKELEDEFGLNWYHYGARYYDPQVSRWHSTDPADEFLSAYVYVGNDPIMLVDPDGRMSSCIPDIPCFFNFQSAFNDPIINSLLESSQDNFFGSATLKLEADLGLELGFESSSFRAGLGISIFQAGTELNLTDGFGLQGEFGKVNLGIGVNSTNVGGEGALFDGKIKILPELEASGKFFTTSSNLPLVNNNNPSIDLGVPFLSVNINFLKLSNSVTQLGDAAERFFNISIGAIEPESSNK